MLYVLNIISHIFCVLQKKIYKQDVLRPKVIVQGAPDTTNTDIAKFHYNEINLPVPKFIACISMTQNSLKNEHGYSEISVITK